MRGSLSLDVVGDAGIDALARGLVAGSCAVIAALQTSLGGAEGGQAYAWQMPAVGHASMAGLTGGAPW